jgi:hypothetical protein
VLLSKFLTVRWIGHVFYVLMVRVALPEIFDASTLLA